MVITPTDKEFRDKVLWCIYGPERFPTLFCCKILDDIHWHSPVPAIWGYSVYEGRPGFRTLGRHLTEWIKEIKNRYEADPIFFDQQDEALAYLSKITIPQL